MENMSVADIKRIATRALTILAATIAFGALVLTMLWRDRSSLDDVTIPLAPSTRDLDSPVTLTWLGVTTMLFDDGVTQILIDGFVSRPSLFQLLTGRPVENDYAAINYFLNEYRIRRLAAIIPVHSHFDHAMDVGAIANRSSASVLGSESTAAVARGAGVPADQILVVSDRAEYNFGEFTVTFIESNHAPIGWRGSVPLPGTIDEDLQMPAPITAWREGITYSIIIAHPSGKTLVHGSGGIRNKSLDGVEVDVVMLGTGLVSSLGRYYFEKYWQSTVTSTGAGTVIPVHFDDFSKPFGTVVLLPNFLDDLVETSVLLEEFRRTWDSDTKLFLPVFGEPIPLYPALEPDTDPEA